MVRTGVGADGNSEELIPRSATQTTNVAPRTATPSSSGSQEKWRHGPIGQNSPCSAGVAASLILSHRSRSLRQWRASYGHQPPKDRLAATVLPDLLLLRP
jgi:hypothetical protein